VAALPAFQDMKNKILYIYLKIKLTKTLFSADIFRQSLQ
jgi:hypothetical protein